MIRAAMSNDSIRHGAHFHEKYALGLAAPDHTVPYGTVLSRDTFPGTSCLATIVLSLRDADLPEVLALSNVQTALRAWLRSCCPSGTKYILPVEALIKLALIGFRPGFQPDFIQPWDGKASKPPRFVRASK
jgi:hypothetical protein